MTSPVEMKALQWFNVTGRGTIALVDMSTFPQDKKLHVGDDLIIDGQLYTCTGIEMAVGMGGTPSNKQGLLVRKKPGDNNA